MARNPEAPPLLKNSPAHLTLRFIPCLPILKNLAATKRKACPVLLRVAVLRLLFLLLWYHPVPAESSELVRILSPEATVPQKAREVTFVVEATIPTEDPATILPSVFRLGLEEVGVGPVNTVGCPRECEKILEIPEAGKKFEKSFQVALRKEEMHIRAFLTQKINANPSPPPRFWRSETLDLNFQPEPQVFAMVVGVSTVSDAVGETKSRWRSICYAANDATTFKTYLEQLGDALKSYNGSEELLRSLRIPRVFFLPNDQAIRRRIRKVLGEILQKTTYKDTFIFYFSGHGHRDEQNGLSLVLIPHDGIYSEIPAEMLGENISWDDIVLQVYNARQREVLGRSVFILDTCFSGAAHVSKLVEKGEVVLLSSALKSEEIQGAPPGGCINDPYSSTGAETSAFTGLLLSALEGRRKEIPSLYSNFDGVKALSIGVLWEHAVTNLKGRHHSPSSITITRPLFLPALKK